MPKTSENKNGITGHQRSMLRSLDFRRFLPVFGEKISDFLKKTNVKIHIEQKLELLLTKGQFFAKIFSKT
jgi:hypothetical protein